jgi:hypothetical protein
MVNTQKPIQRTPVPLKQGQPVSEQEREALIKDLYKPTIKQKASFMVRTLNLKSFAFWGGWFLGLMALAFAIVFAFILINMTRSEIAEIRKDNLFFQEHHILQREAELIDLQIRRANMLSEEDRENLFHDQARLLITNHYNNVRMHEGRRMTADEINRLSRTIYNTAAIHPDLCIWLPFAVMRRESDFYRFAININRNQNGDIFSRDRGLFQFNDGGTAQGHARTIGMDYYEGMEFDIEPSVRMFFSLAEHNRRSLATLRSFHEFENWEEVQIKFVLVAYHRGLSAARQLWATWNGRDLDRFIERSYANSINPNVNPKYAMQVWSNLLYYRENYGHGIYF